MVLSSLGHTLEGDHEPQYFSLFHFVFSSRREQLALSVSCSQQAVLSHQRRTAMGLRNSQTMNQQIFSLFMSCLRLFPYSDGELTNTLGVGLLRSEGSITKGHSNAFKVSLSILCSCSKMPETR